MLPLNVNRALRRAKIARGAAYVYTLGMTVYDDCICVNKCEHHLRY